MDVLDLLHLQKRWIAIHNNCLNFVGSIAAYLNYISKQLFFTFAFLLLTIYDCNENDEDDLPKGDKDDNCSSFIFISFANDDALMLLPN